MTTAVRTSGGWLRRLDAHLDDVGSVRALALLRICLGPVLLLHLEPFVRLVTDGRSYDSQFWSPFWTWYPAVGPEAYAGLVWVGVAAAVAMTVGLATRVATATATLVVAYNVFLSATHFHHNRAFLLILLLAVTLAPSGQILSVDAWLRRRRTGRPVSDLAPLWPLYLLRAQVSLVYLASGGSKLLDPDWWSGLVTWQRLLRVEDQVAASPLGWATGVLTDRAFHTGAAKVVILTELAIAFGLWSRRTRLLAVWLAMAFHLAIQASANVQVFSWAALAALVIWATPAARDRELRLRRDPGAPVAVALVGLLVRGLDWLARFRVVAAGPDDPAMALRDRDGTVRTGADAVATTLSRLPALFFVVAPALAVVRLRSARSPRHA